MRTEKNEHARRIFWMFKSHISYRFVFLFEKYEGIGRTEEKKSERKNTEESHISDDLSLPKRLIRFSCRLYVPLSQCTHSTHCAICTFSDGKYSAHRDDAKVSKCCIEKENERNLNWFIHKSFSINFFFFYWSQSFFFSSWSYLLVPTKSKPQPPFVSGYRQQQKGMAMVFNARALIPQTFSIRLLSQYQTDTHYLID